jgi:hypothetical protein
MQFINSTPEYVASDENFEAMVEKLYFMHSQIALTRLDTQQAVVELHLLGLWTLENLQAAFEQLVQAGALEMPEGYLRELTAQQHHECELLAATNRLDEAIGAYLRFRIGEDICDCMTRNEIKDVLTNPAYRDLRFEAAVWGFTQVQPDAVVDDAFIEFAKPYLKGRYPQASLLKTIYQQYLKQQESQQRSELLEPFNAAPERSLDDLSTEELNNLRTRTLHEMSKRIKNPKRGAIYEQ